MISASTNNNKKNTLLLLLLLSLLFLLLFFILFFLQIKSMVPELDGLEYHEQYSSPPSSSTKWPNFFFFLIKLFMSSGHVGFKKYGTRAHQTQVSQKVVDHYIFLKQCFWTKYFKIDGIWPF